MTGRSLMVRDIPLIPFPHPSDIYISYEVVVMLEETERGRHFHYHQLQDGRTAWVACRRI